MVGFAQSSLLASTGTMMGSAYAEDMDGYADAGVFDQDVDVPDGVLDYGLMDEAPGSVLHGLIGQKVRPPLAQAGTSLQNVQAKLAEQVVPVEALQTHEEVSDSSDVGFLTSCKDYATAYPGTAISGALLTAALGGALLYRRAKRWLTTPFPPKKETNNEPEKEEHPKVNPFADHQTHVASMVAEFEAQTTGRDRANHANIIADEIIKYVHVYEEAHAATQSKLEQREILSAFKSDLQLLFDLLYDWHVDQHPIIRKKVREVERRYYKLENNLFKRLPLFWYAQINQVATYGAFLYIAANVDAHVGFLHKIMPSVFSGNESDGKYLALAAIGVTLWQYIKVSVPYSTVYVGADGFECKNPKGPLGRANNWVVDHVARVVRGAGHYMGLGVIDRILQRKFGSPWETMSMSAKVAVRGALFGMSRYMRYGIPKHVKTYLLENVDGAVPEKAEIAGVRSAKLVAGAMEMVFGALGSVMFSVINKMPASMTIMEKMAEAMTLALIYQEVGPSLWINALMAEANTVVTQYRGNDVVMIMLQRLLMGVTKGGSYNTVTHMAHFGAFNPAYTTGIIWGAQTAIGFAAIAYAYASCNEELRSKIARYRDKLPSDDVVKARVASAMEALPGRRG